MPADLADWLKRGAWSCVYGEAPNFEQALGLAGGAQSARCRARKEIRDLHIRQAGAQLGGDAQAVAAAVRRFKCGKWQNWRRLAAPPRGADQLSACLFYAAQAAVTDGIVRLPESEKQIRRILGQKNQDPLSLELP